MVTGDLIASMNLMPAAPIHASMELLVTTSGQHSAVTVPRGSWVHSANTTSMTAILILALMGELAMILWVISPVLVPLVQRAVGVKGTLTNAMMVLVSMVEYVLTGLEGLSATVTPGTQDHGVREISTSVLQTPAQPRVQQIVSSF